MGAPTTFSFVRDTPNFRLFTGHNPNTGQPVSLWLPWGIITGVDEFAAYVGDYDAGKMSGVEPNGTRLRCCYRDNDQDGNCSVHSAPGVLREPSPVLQQGYDIHREMAKSLRHAELYGAHGFSPPRAFDLCPRPFRTWSNFPLHETPDRIRELNRRLERAENRINTLWKFADKVIQILKWWKLDKK